MAKTFEVIFTETVYAKIHIEAESVSEAEEKFFDGDYDPNKVKDLDSWDAEINEVNEV